jgi:hypothetical protein
MFCKHQKYALLLVLALSSCMKVDIPSPNGGNASKRVSFDIEVTREGESIPPERQANMNGATKAGSSDRPFGLIGIDYDHNAVVVDNEAVSSTGGRYDLFFDALVWDELNTKNVTFSAYYPYVHNIIYDDGLDAYSIPYSIEETSAGPLVSKTVEMAVAQMNMVPLEFQHITNDIGYCVCDVTPDPDLQGLIHLRKVIARNVASAGIFVNDIALSRGIWHRQGYYRDVVVFDGDEKVGVGTENEKFVGYNTLEDRLANSHRYYSIPDEIEIGKQYVEVFFDVEGFTHNGFYYEPLEGQQAKYMIYGLLPDNIFVYGRQYTFHLGLDLSRIYSKITFAPTVGDWETKIYENNDNF